MNKLSAARVVEILAKHGTVVSEEEAKTILDFLTELAEIALAQYWRDISSQHESICYGNER